MGRFTGGGLVLDLKDRRVETGINSSPISFLCLWSILIEDLLFLLFRCEMN